jgi:hypothetical protein
VPKFELVFLNPSYHHETLGRISHNRGDYEKLEVVDSEPDLVLLNLELLDHIQDVDIWLKDRCIKHTTKSNYIIIPFTDYIGYNFKNDLSQYRVRLNKTRDIAVSYNSIVKIRWSVVLSYYGLLITEGCCPAIP